MCRVDPSVCIPLGSLVAPSSTFMEEGIIRLPSGAPGWDRSSNRWPRGTRLNGIPTFLFLGSVGFIFSSVLVKQ